MSNTWGLARKATAIAVRVLDKYGDGTLAYVELSHFQSHNLFSLTFRGIIAGIAAQH